MKEKCRPFDGPAVKSWVAVNERGPGVRRNQLGGQIGTDPVFSPTSHTGRLRPTAMRSFGRRHLRLSTAEQELYDGRHGPALQKTIRAVVDFGEIFGATRLVPLEGAPHHALSWGSRGIDPLLRLYGELAAAGLKTYAPFTSNPKPTDPAHLPMAPDQQSAVDDIFSLMSDLERLNLELGGRSSSDWSCACYVPEVGNTPDFGDRLAWSESSAVTYVNSVIGARSNRNPIGIDMLCSILGKAPYFGLMTDRGRQADWLIEVRTSHLCSPQLLGSAISLAAVEGVPLIAGLDRFLSKRASATFDYLKDLGAAIAGNGGPNLMHIEGLTPEAVRWGRDLLRSGHGTHVVDDDEIERVHTGYPNLWRNRNGVPKRVFLGCPHLTVGQMEEWGRRIADAMAAAGKSKIGIPTSLFASSRVRQAFERRHPELADKLRDLGVSIPSSCPMMCCSTPLEDAELVATNSNKTRVYTTARFFRDDVLTELIVAGELPGRAR